MVVRFVTLAVAILVALGFVTRLRSVDAELADEPSLGAVDYRQSSSCQKCHAEQHETWQATYHRTMTQEASDAAVLGDFDDVRLEFMGHSCRLFREGDDYYMELVDWEWEQDLVGRGIDPATVPDPPRRRYRVDRLVGSHELQVYLHRMPDGRYIVLPLEWNEREGRWVTSAGNYLQPPRPIESLFAHFVTWNETCIFCHNTSPNPARQDAERAASDGVLYRSETAELGIACEACHGPGDLHVARNRDPLRRYLLQLGERDDPTIVHPPRLDQQQSLELCGRCHGKWGVRDEHREAVFAHGDAFVPAHASLSDQYRDPLERADGNYDETVAGYFWPDGTPRPTAMEYQGMLLSPCVERGDMTCLSCHSMHDADPDDQLVHVDDPSTPRWEDNEACTQCHADFVSDADLEAHTNHAANSSGSRCVDCHMPFATFGLMKAVRSHRIVSPDAETTARHRLPNGCNQCHVDRGLNWAARWLSEWYDVDAEEIPDDGLAWNTRELLEGHALNRAIAAISLGREESRAAAPGDWRVPLLLEAMDDEYAAVRFRAALALRALPGWSEAEFDYLAAPESRRAAIGRLDDRWRTRSEWNAELGRETGVRPRSGVDPEILARLLANRDHTPLTILE